MSFEISYIKQRRTGPVKGQCTEATIASLLRIHPKLWEHVVPDLYNESGRTAESERPLYEWLLAQGYRQVRCHFAPRDRINIYNFVVDVDWLPWDFQCHALMGESPSGVPHMMVGKRGEQFWDPNPEGLGLKNIDAFMFLLNKQQCEAAGFDWEAEPQAAAYIIISGEEHLNKFCPYDSNLQPKQGMEEQVSVK